MTLKSSPLVWSLAFMAVLILALTKNVAASSVAASRKSAKENTLSYLTPHYPLTRSVSGIT